MQVCHFFIFLIQNLLGALSMENKSYNIYLTLEQVRKSIRSKYMYVRHDRNKSWRHVILLKHTHGTDIVSEIVSAIESTYDIVLD